MLGQERCIEERLRWYRRHESQFVFVVGKKLVCGRRKLEGRKLVFERRKIVVESSEELRQRCSCRSWRRVHGMMVGNEICSDVQSGRSRSRSDGEEEG